MIAPGYFWSNVLALAAGTIFIRGSLIVLSTRIHISDRLKELFSFIPAAILPAFVAPAVFFHQGRIAAVGGQERLLVLVLAMGVCYRSRSISITIVFGLALLYLSHQLFA